ncbi:hypothetical protein K439DRAFT_1114186 [Ramaria rubella]|nr:hypothetical protein K439DRAFT_1114186 [Ramaria rubella]
MSTNPTFVLGDRESRPPKVNRTVEHIIGNVFTTQGFVGIGIFIQALCTLLLPCSYALLPGAVFIAIVNLPTFLRMTSAYLEFADCSHAGKQPGAAAFTSPGTPERRPPKMALMIIGSQCRSKLGALQPEFKDMGEQFANMIQELRTAPPEDDVGFLNAEFYMHGGKSSGNSNMVCIYWKSYAHMHRFAHKEGGAHLPAWNNFRDLQRDRYKLSTEIGIWHEVYEISNAEAIYHNMPRMGLGDMWDAVPTANGRVVYRNSLVTGSGTYSSAHGRLGYTRSEKGTT